MPLRSEDIRQRAVELGFAAAGVVPVAALGPEGARLTEWLGHGYHGEMAWMERDPAKRADPRLLYPEARSVVAAVMNYYTPHTHDERPGTGKISRYAWGDDYHDVLREKLGELLAWIVQQEPSAEGRICVDTAPMMDKAWAARAGLGWIGKSTNLITREVGSWVFIGELLLNIELDYDDAPIDDHCGKCTACIDACPTQAITEPYVVDARRCLSYATIEHRGDAMPPEVAGRETGWIYGCDICQDVCPWNRFETPAAEARFEPRGGETSLDLDEIASMPHERYVERFRRTAIKRAKLSGLKRNAAALSGTPIEPLRVRSEDTSDPTE